MKVDRIPEQITEAYRQNFTLRREQVGKIFAQAQDATREGNIESALELSQQATEQLQGLPGRDQEEETLVQITSLALTFSNGLANMNIDEIPDDLLIELGREAAERQGVIFQSSIIEPEESVLTCEPTKTQQPEDEAVSITATTERKTEEDPITKLSKDTGISLAELSGRKANLTKKQLAHAAVTYRIGLSNEVEQASMYDAAAVNQDLLLQAGITSDQDAVWKRHGNIEQATTKLERVLRAVRPQSENVTFPLSDDEINTIREAGHDRTAELLDGMNKVQTYQGRNMEEIFEYANQSTDAISLNKTEDSSETGESNPDLKQNRSNNMDIDKEKDDYDTEKAKTEIVFPDLELAYLAGELLKKDNGKNRYFVKQDDRKAVQDYVLENEESSSELEELSEEDVQALEKSVQDKFTKFRKMKKDERKKVLNGLTTGKQIIIGTAMNYLYKSI